MKTNDINEQREYVFKHCFLSLPGILLVPHRLEQGGKDITNFTADQYDVETGQLVHVNRFSVEHTTTLPVASRFQVERVYRSTNLSDKRSKLHLKSALNEMGPFS